MEKKRVLYLGGFELPDKNAAAHRVMSIAKLLRDLGYEVGFIGPVKDRNDVAPEVDGFRCEYVDYPKGTAQWLDYITTFVSPSMIDSFRPDYVILYNFPAVASLKVVGYCHKRGIKVIHDITEWETPRGWSFRELIRRFDINLRMKYCMRKMDGVIAISRYLYDRYKNETKCIMIPPVVDLEDKKWNRDRVLSAGGGVRLVYAGTAGFGNKDKLDIIVNAVQDFPSVSLTVIGMTAEQYENGYGPMPDSCDNVRFLGRVPHHEAVSAVCDADFQMLIREDTLKTRAGFPTKFVESFSSCTPVIATLTSNIGDYLVDGVNGYVVDDMETLKSVIGKASAASADEIIRMKEACRSCEAFDYRSYKGVLASLFE